MTPLLERLIDDAVRGVEGDSLNPRRREIVAGLVAAVVTACSRLALAHGDDTSEYSTHEDIARCIAFTADPLWTPHVHCFNCNRLRANSLDHPGIYEKHDPRATCDATPCPTCDTRRSVFGGP
jgi:hypothetical protein